jgi:hypothetical protein
MRNPEPELPSKVGVRFLTYGNCEIMFMVTVVHTKTMASSCYFSALILKGKIVFIILFFPNVTAKLFSP